MEFWGLGFKTGLGEVSLGLQEVLVNLSVRGFCWVFWREFWKVLPTRPFFGCQHSLFCFCLFSPGCSCFKKI